MDIMRKAAIIVENRNLPYLDKVIQNHMDHLQGFDLIHYSDMIINSGHDYNNLIASPKFWEIDYDKIVIFQHDSGILRNGIDEFLDWDYVGSPWKVTANWARIDRAGGNGGLSVRDVKAHQDLLKIKKYDAKYGNEDVFFTHNLQNVAPYSVCVKFGVETEYQLGTYGWHAIDKHMSLTDTFKIKMQYIEQA
jgi:hypothetical protein